MKVCMLVGACAGLDRARDEVDECRVKLFKCGVVTVFDFMPSESAINARLCTYYVSVSISF